MVIPITAARHGSFGGEKTCHWNARRGVTAAGRPRPWEGERKGIGGRGAGGGAIVGNESKNFLPGGEASGK